MVPNREAPCHQYTNVRVNLQMVTCVVKQGKWLVSLEAKKCVSVKQCHMHQTPNYNSKTQQNYRKMGHMRTIKEIQLNKHLLIAVNVYFPYYTTETVMTFHLFSSYSLKLSVCLSPQSFLSLVNLLSSSQSVWKLLGHQPLANKSKYTLREMPTSVPVSIFHTMHFTFGAIPISAIWGHVCTFYFAANHIAFICQAMPSPIHLQHIAPC